MKNKKLLAIVLLSLSFCFVSGVGYGVGLEKNSVSVTQTEQDFSQLLEAKLQASQLPERYTVLVIPIEQEGALLERYGPLSMLWDLLNMYPEAEIPEEFARVLPSGINDVDKMKRARGHGVFGVYTVSKGLTLSLLLTMAYQQGYRIEHVTSSYVILRKPVYEGEPKE